MAARSASSRQSSSKIVRITYEELVKFADEFDKDKNKKHVKRRSKEKSNEDEHDDEKTNDEYGKTVGDDEKQRLATKAKHKEKKERQNSKKDRQLCDEMPEGGKIPRKRSDKKRVKERLSDGEKGDASDNNTMNAKQRTKPREHTSNSDQKREEITEKKVEESSDGQHNNKKPHKHSPKSKEKSKYQTADKHNGNEDSINNASHNSTQGKRTDQGVDTPDKSDTVKHKSRARREHKRSSSSRKKDRPSSLEGKRLDDETWDGDSRDVFDDKSANHKEGETQTSKYGGILKLDNHTPKQVRVRFSESDEVAESEHTVDDVNEIRGLIRIPVGVNIHQENDSNREDDVYNVADDIHKLSINEQDQLLRNSVGLPDNEESGQFCQQLNEPAIEHRGRKTSESNNGDNVDTAERRPAEEQEDIVKQDKAEKRLKALNRQRAQQLLKLAKQPETSLSNLLSKDITSRESFDKARALSKDIQDLNKGAMLLDLSLASKIDVDHVLWRTAFYNVIETFRKSGKLFLGYSHEKHVMSAEDINRELWDFLAEAGVFYTGLMDALQSMYNFDLHKIINQPRSAELLDRNAKLAMLSCHHILIFLGDIERYKEQMQPSKTINWGSVRSWYLKASKVAPKNGKPYNQLAVIAIYANRKLDAVYYYIRSLAVNSPILTAREKLTTIFYEIQRKAKQIDEDEKEETLRKQRERQQQEEARLGRGRGRGRLHGGSRGAGPMAEGNNNARHEIWVFTCQGTCRRYMITDEGHVQAVNVAGEPIWDDRPADGENTSSPKPESPKISLQEVNKKFMLHFLCAHGFLYTRISMDQLPPLQHLLMEQFYTLLRYPLCSSVSCTSLLQMAAINMFAIDHTASQDDSETYIRLGTPQDQALNLTVDMLVALLAACTALLTNGNAREEHSFHGNDSGYQDNNGFSATLRQYLPAVKVWFDWMMCHCELWQASSISTHRSLWENIASFMNAIIKVDLPLCQEDEQGEELVTLLEDEFLGGFKILSNAKKFSLNVSNKEQKELAEDYVRLLALRDFANFLTSMDNSPLTYNDDTGLYTTSITSAPASPDGKHANVADDVRYHSPQKDADYDDVLVESFEDDNDSGDEDRKGFHELKAKKDALAKEVEAHHERHDKAQAVVHENISRPHLMLENDPTYLVPDTNCFVDHLSSLQAIVDSGNFSLVIPLVVINELDGLGRELMVDKYRDVRHAQRVFQNARYAIDLLEDQFSRRNPQVHALTSKGSVLDTIAYRSEDPSGRKGNNDDVILSCCLHYCEENVVNRLATADQPITIRRKVVLLTDDRNLRLKAYTRNVPVLTVPLFRRMAKV